jgi:predicted CoA-binding protein
MNLPADTDKHTDSEIKSFYELKNIAVVGMSTNEKKPAHFVPKYLIEHGFNVIPVNPTASEILGRATRFGRRRCQERRIKSNMDAVRYLQ